MSTFGLTAMYAIWLREIKTFFREKTRIFGMIGQPLLYLLIVGVGITSGMRLNGSSGNIAYIKYMYPGIIGMTCLFTAMFSAISIVWDREFGFLKEVLVAPVPRWSVAVGKSLGGASVAMVQCVILIALAPLVGIDLSVFIVLKLLVLCFVMSFAVTSLGVVIAVRMQSMQGFQMIMNFIVMPIYFLSGAMFPLKSSPGWMKSLMTLDPLTYGIDALRNVVFSGTAIKIGTSSRSLADVARAAGLIRWHLALDVTVMLVVAAALGAIAANRFSVVE